jgi:hypothetical protein
MRCFFCDGVAHPQTGCQYSETCIACGPCVRDAWKWVKAHTNKRNKKWSNLSFYECASKKDFPIRRVYIRMRALEII